MCDCDASTLLNSAVSIAFDSSQQKFDISFGCIHKAIAFIYSSSFTIMFLFALLFFFFSFLYFLVGLPVGLRPKRICFLFT